MRVALADGAVPPVDEELASLVPGDARALSIASFWVSWTEDGFDPPGRLDGPAPIMGHDMLAFLWHFPIILTISGYLIYIINI